MEKVIKSYKGFNKDMTCRGFQYEEGKEYEEETADACHSGFHACEYPLDCLGYYSPNESVYHEVEQNGEFDRGEDDSWSGLGSYRQNYVKGVSVEDGMVAKVLNIAKHDRMHNTLLALIQNPKTSQVFIINIDGIKKVER